MTKGAAVLTLEEKELFAAKLLTHSGDDGFIEAPKSARRGPVAVPWEMELGELEAWRRNVGLTRPILPVLDDESKTQALSRSIQNRLMSVFEGESWHCDTVDGMICLRYTGHKRARKSKSRAE